MGSGSFTNKFKTELADLYSTHPLRALTILDRLKRSRGRIDDITERDLAVDEITEITDQNHIGGISFTEELARLAGITSTSNVLDLGSGLGGTVRVIAEKYKCEIHGVELTPNRYRDSLELTSLVKLNEYVRFYCGDFLDPCLPLKQYNIILSQSTLVHFPDKSAVVRRCVELLKPNGVLAIEDVFLKNDHLKSINKDIIADLESSWKATISPPSKWVSQLIHSGFEPPFIQDCTSAFIHHFANLTRRTPTAVGDLVSPKERLGWKLGQSLALAGELVYLRTISRLKSNRNALSA